MKKMTLGILHALPQTVILQSRMWNEPEIFCLLLELFKEYSANIVLD